MLSTAFFITFGLKSFEIARLRIRFDYVVRVIVNVESQPHASGSKTFRSLLYCVEVGRVTKSDSRPSTPLSLHKMLATAHPL
jgi:hypothetical protein